MLRVLIVDDSRVMRQIVARTLRQAGYDWDVTEAPDGEEAFRIARAEQPDLVLTDWNMPKVNGIELLEALRAAGDDVPVGFVTSHGTPEMRSRAAAAGALFVVTKPFDAESFRAVLEPVLV